MALGRTPPQDGEKKPSEQQKQQLKPAKGRKSTKQQKAAAKGSKSTSQQQAAEQEGINVDMREESGSDFESMDDSTDSATEDPSLAAAVGQTKKALVEPSRLALAVGPVLGKALETASQRASGSASKPADMITTPLQQREALKRKEAPSPDEAESIEQGKKTRQIDIETEISSRVDKLITGRVLKLQGFEVKNTKGEVKSLTEELLRAAERLKREILGVVKEKLEEVKTEPAGPPAVCDACESRRTEQSVREEQRKKADQEKADEIKRKLRELDTLEELVSLAGEKWPKEAYEQTKYSQMGVAGNRSIRVLIHEGNDKEAQADKTLEQLSKLFPSVKDVDKLENGEVATCSSYLASTLVREGKDGAAGETITLIIGKTVAGAPIIDVTELISKISDKVKKMQEETLDRPMIKVPRGANIDMYRKLIEGCWVNNGIKIGADISKKQPKTKNSADTATAKNSVNRAASRRPQQGSLLISAGESSSADVLKELRTRIDTQAAGVEIRGASKTEGGVRLQLMEKRKGAQSKLATFIETEMKMSTESRGPPLSATISIIGFDLVTTEEEIGKAICKVLKLKDQESFKVGLIRTNRNGDRTTLVRMTRMDAEKITRNSTIKIGWQSCRLREWHTVPLCYRCQQIGHLASRCNAEQTSERGCYRCGEPGHLSKECTAAEAHCNTCRRAGHSAYSSECPRYKQALENIRENRAPRRHANVEPEDYTARNHKSQNAERATEQATSSKQPWITLKHGKKTIQQIDDDEEPQDTTD